VEFGRKSLKIRVLRPLRGEIGENADERRRSVRIEPGPLRVRLSRKWDGILVDISEVGALVQLPVPQTVHTSITLDVEWGHATLQLSGRVVRSSPPAGEGPPNASGLSDYYVAIEFAQLPEESDAALKRLLEKE
jgi:PilZ domain